MNCLICTQPLSEPELQLNRRWHSDCEKCFYCGSEMPAPDQIEKCLRTERPVSHDGCHKSHLLQQFRNRELPIGIQHLRLLNDQMCEHFPLVDPTETDIAQIQEFLVAATELAKNVSWILSLSKDKIRIAKSQEYQQVLTARRETEKVVRRAEVEDEIAKQERTARLQAERENPALRTERKAIEQLAAVMGISLEAARAQLEQMKQQSQAKSKGPQGGN